MLQDKIADRIRKLLELAKSDNEHEAAAAAGRAATLMAEHAVTEAMLEVTDSTHAREPIVEGDLAEKDQTRTRTAWRVTIASAVAKSYDCRTFFMFSNLVALGRTSSVNAWRYTCGYLFATIDRLADSGWARMGGNGESARAWKNAFRLGAASVVAQRLLATVRERAAAQVKTAQLEGAVGAVDATQALVRATQALTIVAQGQAEVNKTFEERTKNFRTAKPLGVTSSRAGFAAGKEAGQTIALTATGGTLPAGK
jgi:hypothetical protein